MKFSEAAENLLSAYQRNTRAKPEAFARTDAYRQFVEAAEQAGFTGPYVEMDSEFSERSPDWVAHAKERDLQRWVHSLLRCDRWNWDHCPDAVWLACRSGTMSVLVTRLAD